MKSLFGDGWGSLFLFVRDGTFNILSPLMVICISYSYVNEIGEECDVSPIIAASVSLASYIAVCGIHSEDFSISNFAATGIFIAIVAATASSALFIRLSAIRFLKTRAYTNGANAAFSHALNSILPAAITVTFFAMISSILSGYFHINNIQIFIQNVFCSLFTKIQSPF